VLRRAVREAAGDPRAAAAAVGLLVAVPGIGMVPVDAGGGDVDPALRLLQVVEQQARALGVLAHADIHRRRIDVGRDVKDVLVVGGHAGEIAGGVVAGDRLAADGLDLLARARPGEPGQGVDFVVRRQDLGDRAAYL